MDLLTILLAFVAGILGYYFLYKPWQYWKDKKIPYVKPLPIFGNGLGLFLRIKTMHQFVQDLYNQSNER